MKIFPFEGYIQIEIPTSKVGSLDLREGTTVQELGIVKAISKSIDSDLKVGDKIFFKSWAVDIITYDDKKYYFINMKSGGITAIIR